MKSYPCPHCGRVFTRARSVGGHVKWCPKNPDPSIREAAAVRLAKTRENRARQMEKALREGCPKPSGNQFTANPNRVMSEETREKLRVAATGKTHSPATKAKISRKLKKWCRENPEKHLWSQQRGASPPCEKLKRDLRNAGFSFCEEFRPLEHRFFRIDIAFPEARLGIEVNGNQHYKSGGALRKYYQERHDLIEAAGWTLLEVHFKDVYWPEAVTGILDQVRFHVPIAQQDSASAS